MSDDTTVYGYCEACSEPKQSESYSCPDCSAELFIKPSESNVSRSVDRDLVVSAIRHADKPFLTASDISECISVSKQTVLNYHDKIRNYRGVESEKVGQANVYWLEDQ